MPEDFDFTDTDFTFLSEMERYDLFMRLYRSPDPEAAARLDSLLASGDPMIPLILLRYLEDLPDKKALSAVLRLIETGNAVVSRAAMIAYQRSHFPGKARLLKRLILSQEFRACKFAVRTLSRAGFMEVLPLLLREIPDRSGNIRKVMINALRFLPHRRSLSVLKPLAQSEADEHTRFLVVRALADIQPRVRALEASFFLDLLKDESPRIREVALEALQRFPNRKVGPMILELARKEDEAEPARIRAIRALSAFPSVDSGREVARIAAGARSAAIRLSAEVVARGFPARVQRKALLPMLKDRSFLVRRQAALFLAEFLGREPKVREALFALWGSAGEGEVLELMDVLRLLGGDDTVGMLREAMKRSPTHAYAAAGALVRARGDRVSRAVLEIVSDPSVSELVRQALLDRWTRRGPDEAVRGELFGKLLDFLNSPTTNIRYLAVQVLGWYPFADIMEPLLELLLSEKDQEVRRVAVLKLGRGLGRDPLPLISTVKRHPRKDELGAHLLRVLISKIWEPELVPFLLEELAGPELDIGKRRPGWFAAVCLHVFEHNAVTLQDVWPYLGRGRTLGRFLMMFKKALRDRRRHFPLLPLPFLELQAAVVETRNRLLIYDLFLIEGRAAAAEYIAASLLRETDPRCLRLGREYLQRLLFGEPADGGVR